MFEKNKKLIIVFIVGSIIVTILSFLIKDSVGYLLTLFGVVLAYAYSKFKVVEPTNPIQEIRPDSLDFLFDCIINTNAQLRLYGYNKEYIAKAEDIFDNLSEIILLVNQKDNYSENTPLINRIATTYLPKLINSFLSLSKEEQLKITTFYGLDSVDLAINNARKSIELHNISEFNKQVNFMKSFFEGDYSNEENIKNGDSK